MFQRLTLSDCAWHYHGILEAPEGAQVLVKLATGEALLCVDQVSAAGTVVVSTLDPISHYGGYFMPGHWTVPRCLPSLGCRCVAGIDHSAVMK